jgi:outer membrane protein W
MKKIILSAAAIFAFSFANAQDSKEGGAGFASGDLFVSGAIGIGSTSSGDVKSSSTTFSPSIGYFMSENIAIGARIGFGSTNDDDGSGVEVKTSEFSLGGYGRYYATPSSNFSLFAELGINYTSAEDAAEIKVNTLGLAFAPGVSYFMSDNWAVEASIAALSYSSAKADVEGAEAANSLNLGIDLTNINFALIYKF